MARGQHLCCHVDAFCYLLSDQVATTCYLRKKLISNTALNSDPGPHNLKWDAPTTQPPTVALLPNAEHQEKWQETARLEIKPTTVDPKSDSLPNESLSTVKSNTDILLGSNHYFAVSKGAILQGTCYRVISCVNSIWFAQMIKNITCIRLNNFL